MGMISSNAPARGGGGTPIVGVGRTPIRGVGKDFYPLDGSWVTVVGKAGDVKYIGINQILRQSIEVGIYVQSSAAATVAYTLDHPATSTDPRSAADANWTADQSLTAGEIVQTDAPVFAAVSVTFTADGFVTFYAM